MPISPISPNVQLNAPQPADRLRDDKNAELEVEQADTPVATEDINTTAEPVQETTASETTQNQNNEQVTRGRDEAPTPEETLGSQIDTRA